MKAKLAVLLGGAPELADQLADQLGVRARVGPEVHHSCSAQDAFLWMLGAFLRAEAGAGAVLKLAKPLPLPVALRRMLERVALGLGCLSLDGASGAQPPRSWLVGGCLEAVKATPESLEFIGSYSEEALTNGASGLGQWPSLLRPNVTLLVGERPSGRWKGRPNWPFISSNHSGCSAWLAEQLEEAGIPESELYWLNAYNYKGEPHSAEALMGVMFSSVIALGKKAHMWLDLNCIEHRQVHHPMYWKRYHANDKYILATILKEPF